MRELAGQLGAPDEAFTTPGGPVWTGVTPDRVLEFLRTYRVDAESHSISIPLICAYIERLVDAGELVRWTVTVCGRETTKVCVPVGRAGCSRLAAGRRRTLKDWVDQGC